MGEAGLSRVLNEGKLQVLSACASGSKSRPVLLQRGLAMLKIAD